MLLRHPRQIARLSSATARLSRLSPVLLFLLGTLAPAQALQLTRDGATLVLEPYGPNLIRITLSKSAADATAAPGYGIVGKPDGTGWAHESTPAGDILRSPALVVEVAPAEQAEADRPHPMPLDTLNQDLRRPFFGGPDTGSAKDQSISIRTAAGKPLLTLRHWSMIPNIASPADPTLRPEASRVSAVFSAADDEHFYGLGQHHAGFLDLRHHHIDCWHDYGKLGGEEVCVPFMVSSRGYGLLWDNPSKTSIDLGINGENLWSSAIGDRVSFFVIAGSSADTIYTGYRQLTGVTHLLPRGVYGYIQSKAIYPTQQSILDVAKQYRERNLPADVLVVDFLNATQQGNLDLDPTRWPDPAAMNDQLHQLGFRSLLSVWPHFAAGSHFYNMLLEKNWLITTEDGTPDLGTFRPIVGPNIDTTNPAASKWWWEAIRDRYLKPDHFDYLWLDETEPDIDPEHDRYSIGSGARFYNVYPLFHTASVYEGFRRDFGDSRRCMILARAAYLGAQRNCTIFWSSDIVATWDMLKRSVPAGLNVTASGMPYWDTDIAGFFSPTLPAGYHAAHPPLIDGSDVQPMIGRYEDYPELFVRWFQWGVFQPILRTHGEREHNEVWSYGKQATPILEKYLRLRYQLLPYIYSLAYSSYQTGAPYTRSLWMDFPLDSNAADIPDEYMFGPALLVAPVTDQGATHRQVYLPAGADWFNFWTHERLHGGQTITADAPIDTIPLFVRAGSILPLAAPARNAQDAQTIASVEVFPGADADLVLFNDDGDSYAYEHGKASVTRLHWDDAAHKLTHQGPPAWTGSDTTVIKIVSALATQQTLSH